MKTLLLIVALIPCLLSAQNQPGTQLHIKRAKGPIVLDGKLDEPDWQTADVAKDWYLNYPTDTALAPYQTEARVTFDDQFFYVSFVGYDDDTPDLINSLRRDFIYPLNDNFGVNIGPYNDGLNGFFFALTPAGVQREGIISGGGNGENAFNDYWDNKWHSKVVRHKDHWIAEASVPWKSFRYKSGLREWNIIFDRSDKKRNLRSSWISTPIQFATGMFAFAGKLIWDDPPPPARTNISFSPYVAGSTARDNEVSPARSDSELQAGFDAKVGITPSMNLDVTVNPDFSHVEVDQQVINLTRFEFQFPERRQFFLENSDLFARAGLPRAQLFFSRRIGLARDSSGLFQKVPIAYGARLSGSFNEKWRLSVMNMQTRKELSLGLPAQNFAVATVQRNFWSQSSVSLTVVNKQSLNVGDADTVRYFHESIFRETFGNGNRNLQSNTFNRVVDLDLELISKDNILRSSSFVAKSFDNFNESKTFSAGTHFEYESRNLYVGFNPTYIGENFNAEVGFVPSSGVYPGQIYYQTELSYRFYPEHKSLIWTGPSLIVDHVYIPGGELTDKDYKLGYSFNFINTAILKFSYNHIFQRLPRDFSLVDPTRYDPFLAGEQYTWQTGAVSFQSNTRKVFNFLVETIYGSFYNGTNFNVNGQLNYRYQPFGNVSLQFDYNDLNLPDNYGKEKLFLIGPRVDLTLSDKVFLTTYVQYNNLLDNMNLNARFQWRYQPASDLFIVYTENYFPGEFTSKNRALVFKLTYWLNL